MGVKVGFLVLLCVAGACRGGAGPEPADALPTAEIVATPSLAGDLVGLWEGRGGSAEFRPDGTVRVRIRACEVDPESFDWSKSCQPFEADGPYTIDGTELRVDLGEGTAAWIVGYIDHRARLRLAPPRYVSPLSRDKTGTISLYTVRRFSNTADTLTIEGSTCRWRDGIYKAVVESECKWQPFHEEDLEIISYDTQPRWGEAPYPIRRQTTLYSPADGVALSSTTVYVRLEKVKSQ